MFFNTNFIKISRLYKKKIFIFNYNNFFLKKYFFVNKFKYFFYKKVSLKIKYNYLIFNENFFKKKFLNLLQGTLRSILYNTIYGFKFFYIKKLILYGLNYKIFIKNRNLFINLGYSHPLIYKIPINIFIFSFNNEIYFISFNKQLVNKFSSSIKRLKKSVYKLKGFKYYNEIKNLKNIKKK